MSKKAITSRPTVATFNSLPASGNVEGDYRMVADTGNQYYWSIIAASGAITDWKLLNDAEPSTINTSEKLNLELEQEFKLAQLDRFVELTYTGPRVTGIDVYTDAGKTVQLFGKVLTYSGNSLIATVLTRTSDSATITKSFAYTGIRLDTITVS